ncbi:MAG: hypothetical protein HYU59_10945 [Magnetospirillum gryphiswaldense]|nr:hypothetical protein [Magnetospirillum gryphiswaldense]
MRRQADRIQVKLVESVEEMNRALAVRAAVCLGEFGWPFVEFMDGNDFSCSHLLATVDGEPAGTMRIRYYGEFAKPEWLVVLNRFRRGRFGGVGVPMALGAFARDFCRKKGFTKLYGHSAPDLETFWNRIGGPSNRRLSNDPVRVGEHKGEIIPMMADYDQLDDAITLQTLTTHAGHALFSKSEAAIVQAVAGLEME